MDLLFERRQTPGRFRRVHFALWCKAELDEEEQALLNRYRMRSAILIHTEQEDLRKHALSAGLTVSIVLGIALYALVGRLSLQMIWMLIGAGVAAAYWFFHEQRETIYVKDLLHGRTFICTSVVELLKKEAYLHSAATYLRQVLESAKHWDGTEHISVTPLPKEQAWKMVRKG